MELGKKDEEETANKLKMSAKAKINCGGEAPTETVGFLSLPKCGAKGSRLMLGVWGGPCSLSF